MSKSIALIIGLVLLVVLVLFSMTYTVKYNEVAIRTRFGKTDANSIVDSPGLHFRLPLFADKVTTLDTRLQLRESSLETIQTIDKQQVLVRAFLIWQVDRSTPDGPLKFFVSYPGGIDEANQWLSTPLVSALRTGLGRYSFDELMGAKSRISDAEKSIKDALAEATSRGIQPVSVGISQMVLPPKTTTAVLARMQATREYLSQAERGKGDAEATAIQSKAQSEANMIQAFAEQRAEEIRAAGNQDAAKYIQLMGQDQGLAIFLAWLDTLQSSLSQQTTFVVPTAFAPFHLLRLDTPTDSHGIPQPVAEIAGETQAVAGSSKPGNVDPPKSAHPDTADKSSASGGS